MKGGVYRMLTIILQRTCQWDFPFSHHSPFDLHVLELSCQQTKIRQIYRNYEKLSLILQQIHTLVTKNGTPCIKYF